MWRTGGVSQVSSLFLGALFASCWCTDQPPALAATDSRAATAIRPAQSATYYRDPLRLIYADIPGTTRKVVFPGEGGFARSAIVRYSFEDGVDVQITDHWLGASRESALAAELPQRSDTVLYEKVCSFQFVTVAPTVTCSPFRDFSRVTWWRHVGFDFSVGVQASSDVTNERATEAVDTVVGALMTHLSVETR